MVRLPEEEWEKVVVEDEDTRDLQREKTWSGEKIRYVEEGEDGIDVDWENG